MFPKLARFNDFGLLFLRVMVGLVFADSGYDDLKDPAARSKSIEMPKSFTVFLGTAELLGGVALILGLLTQLAALGLILVMLGALQKKIFVWKTGFWGKDGLGWNYELIIVSMLLVVLSSDGGGFTVSRLISPEAEL
ncbi:MAG: DoxX family protein [Vulcanimicrobiaceae bacterium]